ncbi:hypothetical protein [Vampirovibrio sp.]|uniref:hypothetical protein n=1 Tax=Vampirovibrio sp. TaxID=2717857 RepID=UPI003593D228
MSFIGPNFRPPGQRNPAAGAGQSAGPNAAGGPSTAAGSTEPSTTHRAPLGADGTLSLATLLARQNPLAPAQLAQLLRNLLSMPRELVQLLALLSQQDPAAGQALLQTLLSEEVKIPLEALQDFLQGRVDKAQEKLLKLLQGNPAALSGAGEMGELMKGLSALSAQSAQAPTEALHATITLYLPFYPLHPPQAFTLRFEPPDEEAGGPEGGEAPQLVVYMETMTLGAFRVVILTGPESCWQAIVSHEPIATAFTAQIESALREATPLEQPTLVFTLQSGRRFTEGKAKASYAGDEGAAPVNAGSKAATQSVGLHPVGGVSARVIHAAYLLIRVILELDNQTALQQGRASAI